MSIQPLWLTHFIKILLVLEFQLTKFIVGMFYYKAHFRPQISSNGSSNNIVADSIRLRLFQCTLTSAIAKLYFELPQAKYPYFNSLAFMFLQYFQLPVRYDEGVEILFSCRENTTTHITKHIHEWWWRCSLCKIQLDDRIFLDWFLKTLLPPIAKDVASECPQSKEEAILKAQQFDLIYA